MSSIIRVYVYFKYYVCPKNINWLASYYRHLVYSYRYVYTIDTQMKVKAYRNWAVSCIYENAALTEGAQKHFFLMFFFSPLFLYPLPLASSTALLQLVHMEWRPNSTR